jgi:pimeloyl-ACP methyl ester carboxylesterase
MKPSTVLKNQGAYAQVNGLHMYYETYGEGIPVILLHGGLETCQMWAPVIPSFSQNYKVFTPDTRGHGRTNNPSGKFSYPLLAEDIARFINALELKDTLIAGYSDGGQIALEMSMAYPGLVQGYMVGAVYNTMMVEWRQMIQGPLGFDGPGVVDFERVIQMNADLVHSLEKKHDVLHEPGYWKSLLTQVSQAWWEPPAHTQADFAMITEPVLFWCGDRDVFCPPEQSLEMYRMVNKAEIAVIPNADHFTMANQFEITTMVLLNFMQRVIAQN